MPVARLSSRSASTLAVWFLALLLALTVAAAVASTARAAQPGNPMAGAPWYVDDQFEVSLAAHDAAFSGDLSAAARLDVIARTPQSKWFIAADDPSSSSYVRGFFDRWQSTAPGTTAVITLHGLPQQVCAGENAPGLASAASYRDWIDGWTRLIGDRRVVVFLEPDGLAASKCLSRAARRERVDLMAYATRRLSLLPHTGVYEDIGAGDWLSLDDAARLLRAAGVARARGFSLNTTHFDWTADEVAYGIRLSRRLGGKHFVVNTSANGRGPLVVRARFHEWCNPRARSLGPLPTTRTPSPLVDAFFWLINPGLSDGTCNGGPTVGSFWQSWALELVDRSAGAPDFPTFRGARALAAALRRPGR